MTGQVWGGGAAPAKSALCDQDADLLQDARGGATDGDAGANPDLWLYRERTVAVLRRYMRLSLEVGRLPSLLGREFFRTRVTCDHTQTFEDTVIFVHDIERCLDALSEIDKTLIGLITFREYNHYEAARLMGCTRRSIVRLYSAALDRVTEIFLKWEILTALPARELDRAQACQGGELEEFLVNNSE